MLMPQSTHCNMSQKRRITTGKKATKPMANQLTGTTDRSVFLNDSQSLDDNQLFQKAVDRA